MAVSKLPHTGARRRDAGRATTPDGRQPNQCCRCIQAFGRVLARGDGAHESASLLSLARSSAQLDLFFYNMPSSLLFLLFVVVVAVAVVVAVVAV